MALGVVESSMRSRLGPPEHSADLLLIAPHLVAVVSGTSFSMGAETALPRGLTPARFAATVGLAGLRAADPDATLPEVVTALTKGLNDALRHVQPGGMRLNVGYAFAAISNTHREVWQVGGVGALWDEFPSGVSHGDEPNILPSLRVVAEARSLILHALISRSGQEDGGKGFSPQSLRAKDLAQPMLSPLLVAHASLANQSGPLGYGLINGQPVPDEHLRAEPLPPGPREVSLGSGGYPVLKGTLAATERHLNEVIRHDPLLITRFPYVRPVRLGHESFADRAYARVRVW